MEVIDNASEMADEVFSVIEDSTSPEIALALRRLAFFTGGVVAYEVLSPETFSTDVRSLIEKYPIGGRVGVAIGCGALCYHLLSRPEQDKIQQGVSWAWNRAREALGYDR